MSNVKVVAADQNAANGVDQKALALRVTTARGTLATLQQSPREGGGMLVLKRDSDRFDAVIGDLPRDLALELMDNQLTDARRAELHAGRGDLPAAAIYHERPEGVIAAFLADVASVSDLTDGDGDEDDEPKAVSIALLAPRWAAKVLGHPEYEEILETNLEVIPFSFGDALIVGLSLEFRDDFSPDMFENLGLDYLDSLARLRVLRQSFQDEVDPDDVQAFLMELGRRRIQLEKGAAPEAQVALSQAAADLDL